MSQAVIVCFSKVTGKPLLLLFSNDRGGKPLEIPANQFMYEKQIWWS